MKKKIDPVVVQATRGRTAFLYDKAARTVAVPTVILDLLAQMMLRLDDLETLAGYPEPAEKAQELSKVDTQGR